VDISHEPEEVDESLTVFVCRDCGMDLPQPVCIIASGMGVVEIGDGAGFVPNDGLPGAIACTHPSVEAHRKAAREAAEASASAAAPQAGETTKPARPLSDFEKMVNAASFDNFLQLREATKPKR
jgi:NAD(P)H-dependent flavin oxidoreductase YrpB (nitropropane dioxygenase family)